MELLVLVLYTLLSRFLAREFWNGNSVCQSNSKNQWRCKLVNFETASNHKSSVFLCSFCTIRLYLTMASMDKSTDFISNYKRLLQNWKCLAKARSVSSIMNVIQSLNFSVAHGYWECLAQHCHFSGNDCDDDNENVSYITLISMDMIRFQETFHSLQKCDLIGFIDYQKIPICMFHNNNIIIIMIIYVAIGNLPII